jgi:hypothetical protein
LVVYPGSPRVTKVEFIVWVMAAGLVVYLGNPWVTKVEFSAGGGSGFGCSPRKHKGDKAILANLPVKQFTNLTIFGHLIGARDK